MIYLSVTFVPTVILITLKINRYEMYKKMSSCWEQFKDEYLRSNKINKIDLNKQMSSWIKSVRKVYFPLGQPKTHRKNFKEACKFLLPINWICWCLKLIFRPFGAKWKIQRYYEMFQSVALYNINPCLSHLPVLSW